MKSKQSNMFCQPPASMDSIITLNVGGELFQTTISTLHRAGPTSLLSQIPPSSPAPHFLDRDPHLFSHLLFFLRHGRLRPHLSSSLLSSILHESHFYSLYPQICLSFSHPSNFSPFKLRPCFSLPLPGRDYALSVSLLNVGPTVLLTSHGGKLSFFDPALLHRFTTLTPLPAIDSLVSVSESVAALGAHDYPGLHVYSNLGANSENSSSTSSVLHWGEIDATATVEAVASANPGLVFASFESARRTVSGIVAFDVNSLAPVVEIGRKEVYGADVESAIPAKRLSWVDGKNLLLAAGSHSGPAGVIGDVRLWDVRASAAKPVWEIREKDDCFADVAVSDALNAVFKVGVVSGEVFAMDLRMLGTATSTEPWKCIGDEGRKAAVAGRKEGSGCRVECCGKWVFVTRGAEVEVWTEIALAGGGSEKKVMRRNWVGKGPDGDGGKKRIVGWAFGGSRMVLARENQRSVEVWDSTAPAVAAVTTV